ncbi:hypothetical protein HHX47_DHR7000387 [Lentinula edodes]|nr:hypothetical protein HHX47_DHR7000387 [Lentinula edodes]
MLFAPQNPKYVITASVWVYFQKNKRHVLLLGTMRGDIILWVWNDDNKTPFLKRNSSPNTKWRKPTHRETGGRYEAKAMARQNRDQSPIIVRTDIMALE